MLFPKNMFPYENDKMSIQKQTNFVTNSSGLETDDSNVQSARLKFDCFCAS